MGILKKDGTEGKTQRRDDQQQALARREQHGELVRDPFQLMNRDPFQLMREMMIDPFRVFQQMAPWSAFGRGDRRELGWNPSFDIHETDDAYIFEADMPGVREQDLDVQLAGNNLQITGKRDREEERDEGTVHSYERSFGQFSRSFALPEHADLDKVRCDLKDGVLTLVVPKKPGTAPHRRKIQIGSGSKS